MADGESREKYTCAYCGGTFMRDDAAEQRARVEALKQWGHPAHDPRMVVICDECYQEFIAWYRSTTH